MNSQKGLVPILIVTLIAVLVGGYFIYSKSQTKTPPAQPTISSTPHLSQSPSDETSNWKTYSDSIYLYSLSIPSDSKIEEKTGKELENVFGNPLKQILITPNIASNKNAFHFYWIMVYPNKDEVSVENWIRKYEANGEGLTLSDTTLAGMPAKNVANLVGGIYEREGVYVIKGNYVYSIVISAQLMNDQTKAEYNQILSTFRFD